MTIMESQDVRLHRSFMELHDEDRALVDLLRRTGVDFSGALACSGVFRPRGERMYSAAGSADPWTRMSDPDARRKRAAEHESAHLLAAVVLGVRPREARIEDDGSGWTRHDEAPPEKRAVIAAAGHVWISEFRGAEFPADTGGGCGDDLREVTRASGGGLAEVEAYQRAHDLLSAHPNHVLCLAGQLQLSGRLVF